MTATTPNLWFNHFKKLIEGEEKSEYPKILILLESILTENQQERHHREFSKDGEKRMEELQMSIDFLKEKLAEK